MISTATVPAMFDSKVGRFSGFILAGVLACMLSPNPGLATTLKIGGTGAALGTARILADAFTQKNPDISIEVPGSLGSRGGIKAVIAGALDVGLSSRPLKSKERQAGARQIHYARTPFVLVTSARDSNSRPTLSSPQLVEIFSGASTYWGDGAPIRIILRGERDTSTRLLISAFEGMHAALAKARAIPGIPVTPTEQDNMDLAESLAGSLTTASLTALLAENRALTPVAIDGVAPTLDNLANGSYRFSKSFYIVTGPEISGPARAFIQFVLSADGAAILRATGNLPIAPNG